MARNAWSYPSCRAKVILYGGTADAVVNNGLHALCAAAAIPGGRFRWIDGAGHMLHHFHQDLILRTVLDLREEAA